MTAKEYLSQYRAAQVKIEHREKQLADFEASIGLSGINLSEKVQTSPRDSLSEDVARAVDIEAEIRAEKLKLEELKHKIIGEIHQLENPVFVAILFKRYVELKNLWEISQEKDTFYSYDRIRHLHGYALQDFYNRFLKPTHDDTQ